MLQAVEFELGLTWESKMQGDLNSDDSIRLRQRLSKLEFLLRDF